MKKSKLVVNTKSSSAVTSIVLLVLSILFVIIGKWRVIFPLSMANMEMIKYIAMPVVSSVLFILCILLLGRKAFVVSVLPLVIASVATMVKAFEMSSIIGYGELLICVILIVVYCCTIFGALRRFFFAAITIILIAYHSYFVVYSEITTSIYTFSQLAYEIGIIFMYTGFVFAVCGATRKRTIDPNTATTVVPPIPGGSGLAEKKNVAVSEPEPEKCENNEVVQIITDEEPEAETKTELPTEPEIDLVVDNVTDDVQKSEEIAENTDILTQCADVPVEQENTEDNTVESTKTERKSFFSKLLGSKENASETPANEDQGKKEEE